MAAYAGDLAARRALNSTVDPPARRTDWARGLTSLEPDLSAWFAVELIVNIGLPELGLALEAHGARDLGSVFVEVTCHANSRSPIQADRADQAIAGFEALTRTAKGRPRRLFVAALAGLRAARTRGEAESLRAIRRALAVVHPEERDDLFGAIKHAMAGKALVFDGPGNPWRVPGENPLR